MKYCTHCGAEVLDEAVVCVHCGCKIDDAKKSSDNSTMATLVKIFMILGTILMGLSTFFIGLAWCIPMTVSVCKKLENHEPIGTGLKVCSLLFVSMVAGILMLCMNED
ncbi:MAG: zinc-ribbon domain-containing protein [Candidatus Fimimonas sp.]